MCCLLLLELVEYGRWYREGDFQLQFGLHPIKFLLFLYHLIHYWRKWKTRYFYPMLKDRFVYPIKTCVLIPLSMQGLKTLLLKDRTWSLLWFSGSVHKFCIWNSFTGSSVLVQSINGKKKRDFESNNWSSNSICG